MVFEEWMVNIVIGLVAAIATYATLRNRVARLEEDRDKHLREDGVYHQDSKRVMDAQSKIVNELISRVIVLEQAGNTHLDIKTAEDRFVSKYELELQLKNLETGMRHTANTVDKIEGKLEQLVSVLSENHVTVGS